MKTTFKNAIIVTGGNAVLSETVQRVLFGLGYGWSYGEQVPKWTVEIALYTCKSGDLNFGLGDPHCDDKSAPTFNAATQFGELLAFLAEEKEHLDFRAKSGNVVMFRDGAVFIEHSIGSIAVLEKGEIKAIHDRLFPAPETIMLGPEHEARDCGTFFRFKGFDFGISKDAILRLSDAIRPNQIAELEKWKQVATEYHANFKAMESEFSVAERLFAELTK